MRSLFFYLVSVISGYLITGPAYGQEHPYEIKLVTENDSYRWNLHDGYYTNGLFVRFNYLPRRLNARIPEGGQLAKVTSSYEVGQMMFNPEKITDINPDQIDRPYAGYLFARKSVTFLYRSGNVLNANVSLGTIGPASLAQPAQLLIHRTFHFKRPHGWSNQVNDEVGLNAQVQYQYDFIRSSAVRKWIDLHGTSQITLGNTFTNASVGALLQIGLFEWAAQSAMYDARVNRGRRRARKPAELFVYFHPQYQYQVYNATVQGGLFRHDKGPVLAPINPWVYGHETGFVFARHRWTAVVTYSLKQREASTMRHLEKYGGFSLAYRMGHGL